MSFYSKEESFFLDAVASTTCPIVQIVPLTDIDVFNYLDAHPNALREYFKDREGYAWTFFEIPFQDLTGEEYVPADDGNEPDREAQRLRSLFENEPVPPPEPDAFDEEAAASEVSQESHFPESELVSRRWEEAPIPSFFPSAPQPSSDPFIHRHFSLSSSSSSSPSPSPSPPPPIPSPPPPPPPQPQPAPPASLPQKNSRSWSAAEEESCCKHMKAVCQEGNIRGEARFRETQRRMVEIDHFQYRGATAVKNFWNRVGRARCNLDERKNKKAPLATSQQGKSANSSRSVASSDAKSSQAVRKSSTLPKRRPLKQTPDTDSNSDSDIEQGYDTADTTPLSVKKLPKRDRGDSESEWEPDQDMFNAVAKGIRAPKKARVSY